MSEPNKDESLGATVLRNLAPYQKQSGLNDRELALRAGIDPSYIYKVREGKIKKMGFGIIVKLAAYFGVTPETLTSGVTFDVPMPSADLYYAQKHGLVDRQMVALLETLAAELAVDAEGLSPANEAATRTLKADIKQLIYVWFKLSDEQRKALLVIAHGLIK